MATRALIGYLENGVLTTTYNHYDGYPENLGKALNNFYNTPEKAKEIANEGYISYIDPETGEIEAANQDTPDKLIHTELIMLISLHQILVLGMLLKIMVFVL